MKGRQWCEYAAPNFLPALRANIVLNLSQHFGLSQRQMARRLGLSQAAVSHYVTQRRGSGASLRTHPDLMRYANKLAERVAGGLSGARLTAAICGICTSFRQAEGIQPCLCVYEGVSKPDFLSSLGDEAGFPRQPCETFVVQRLIPLIRSGAARILSTSLSQQQVASVLGVTQPAVSQYVSSQRGEGPLAEDIPELRDGIQDLAVGLQKGLSTEERQNSICHICVQSRKVLARVGSG